MKAVSVTELYKQLPDNERMVVDVLRQIIKDNLPDYCREELAWCVPIFKGNKTICIVWPATVPRGGITDGVLLGFWYGNRLDDVDRYLKSGTNKQIFYRVFHSPEQINQRAVVKLLKEAVKLDQSFRKKSR